MLTECDYCEVQFEAKDRVVVCQSRPSDPAELCAVLWGCGECEETKDWHTPVQIQQKLENGELPGILFLTL